MVSGQWSASVVSRQSSVVSSVICLHPIHPLAFTGLFTDQVGPITVRAVAIGASVHGPSTRPPNSHAISTADQAEPAAQRRAGSASRKAETMRVPAFDIQIAKERNPARRNPPSHRTPYHSAASNQALNLAFVHNGLPTHDLRPRPAPGRRRASGPAGATAQTSVHGLSPEFHASFQDAPR